MDKPDTIQTETLSHGFTLPPFGAIPGDVRRVEVYWEQEIAIYRSGSQWLVVTAHSPDSCFRNHTPRLLLKQRTRRLARLVARIATGDDEAAEQWLDATLSPSLQGKFLAIARQQVSLVRERYETR